MSEQARSPSAWSGILLVAGTCIGAGMLALPVVTADAGFGPAMFVNTFCWLLMMATGLLFLEATLWMEDGANVLSMAKRFLGRTGWVIGGAFFVFLYYCLMISYLSGGAPLFEIVLKNAAGIKLSDGVSFTFFVAIFGLIVLLGTLVVDRINWILMIGLIGSYILMLFVGSGEVQTALLTRQKWFIGFMAAPTFFSAFGYHNIIPSITTYLQRNVQRLRLAIIVGTTIPFIVYSLWQWLIIGTVPLDVLELSHEEGVPISQTLEIVTGHRWIHLLVTYFGFFALVTSLLGVALSMVDFLGDGLKMKRTGLARVFLCMLVFIPPALFAAYNPGVFLEAIGIAGGYGEAVLNGLLPVAMVWVGRYSFKLQRQDQLPGGKPMLVVIALVTFSIVILETYHLFSKGLIAIAE